VLALFFQFHNVGMAGLTGIVAGECNGPGRGLGDRRPAIVPVLPKAFRNDGGAQHDKSNNRDCYDDSEPDEVFQVLEQVPIPAPDSRRDLRKIAQYLWIPTIRFANDDRSHRNL